MSQSKSSASPTVVALAVDEQHDHGVLSSEKHEYSIEDAQRGLEFEKNLTLLQGIRAYPKAAFWSFALSTCLVMEGYDTGLVGTFFGMPSFQRKYGEPVAGKPGQFQLSASWQTGLSDGNVTGEILGLFLAGFLADRLGYRMTLFLFLVALIGFIFILVFAPTIQVLLVGQMLCGLCWGAFQTLTTTYASEVCPPVLRPYLTTYINGCWELGHLIAAGVQRAMVNKPITDSIGYHLPFALQWIWPVPILVAVYFAPESPWWLVRQGRNEDAFVAVRRLNSNGTDDEIKSVVAMMVHTHDMEVAAQKGSSYLDLFRGTNRRRTELATVAYVAQALCGSTFRGYSTYFFEQAGLDTNFAFDLSCALYGVGILGVLLSWVILTLTGRRMLYMFGLSTLMVILFIVGCIGLGPLEANSNLSWAIGAMIIVQNFVYDSTLGPGPYVVASELPASLLRAKTVAFARNCYNMVNIINGVLTPRELNPTAWNWSAKTGFFWAGFNLILLVWTYFRLPETKGLTFAEIDQLFEQRVPARQFSTTVSQPF